MFNAITITTLSHPTPWVVPMDIPSQNMCMGLLKAYPHIYMHPQLGYGYTHDIPYPLHTKSVALVATCQFLQMVKTQFQVFVQGWMLDFGRENKSATYDDLLKGESIKIYNNAPHVCQVRVLQAQV